MEMLHIRLKIMVENSTSKKHELFDLIVIGTGTAASVSAVQCSSAGWRVAIIDSLPFGGTCALRGCEPKKVLVEAAKVIDSNISHKDKGIVGSENLQIKWSELIRFKRTFTEPYPKHREEVYEKAGIIPFHGHAKFVGSTTLAVKSKLNDTKGGDIILNAKHILIATGAKPMKLNIAGEENIITSDQFLEYAGEHLPDKIVFVGGGYISFEFAHVAARAGAKVTILHRGKRPLEHFDPDLVNQLMQRSQDIGIDFYLHSEVEKINRSSDDLCSVQFSNTSTNSNTPPRSNVLEANMVVHSAGRQANVDELDLAAAGIEYTGRGIRVNEYLQSVSNHYVYAAGDAAASDGFPLTPTATYEGSLAATNLINGNTVRTNYKGLPSVVFTIPSLASVGMQEKEAQARGLKFRTRYKNTSSWISTRRVGETHSGFKVLIEDQTNRILGAHILGPHAEEVINIFSMAIRLGLTSNELNDPLLYAYPTSSSDVVYML
jgi:glutathione reductase (NADPH)